MDGMTLAGALAAGVAIAAASGLRAFLPLLALGLAGRFAGLPLNEGARWLQSDLALVALAVAALLEIAADKIPVLDHLLDGVGTGLRPLSAAFGAYAVLVAWPEPWGLVLGLVLGGGALAVQLLRAQARLASTLLTGGAGNPVLSVAEDAATVVLLAAALLAPLLGMLLVVAALVAWARRRRRLSDGRRA